MNNSYPSLREKFRSANYAGTFMFNWRVLINLIFKIMKILIEDANLWPIQYAYKSSFKVIVL